MSASQRWLGVAPPEALIASGKAASTFLNGAHGYMKARELIATAVVPGGANLRLFRRDDDFMIVLGGNELMSSRMSGSEDARALMTCARLRNRAAPRVLVGG